MSSLLEIIANSYCAFYIQAPTSIHLFPILTLKGGRTMITPILQMNKLKSEEVK